MHLAVQNLWQSLVNNVLCNYFGKEIKSVIAWIYEQISAIRDKAEDIGNFELNQLNVIFELVYLINRDSDSKFSRSNLDSITHDVSNQYSNQSKTNADGDWTLIKVQTKNHLDLDLYSLVSPILFWCDYAVEKESRINIFKPAWKALVTILEVLPIDTNSELIPIVLPYLEEIHVFEMKSSPTLSMLKFINLIIRPIKKNTMMYEPPLSNKMYKKFVKFLLSFILSFSRWVPHNLNEEAFKVLDSLLYTVRFSLKYVHI